jgi:hypothetical protein
MTYLLGDIFSRRHLAIHSWPPWDLFFDLEGSFGRAENPREQSLSASNSSLRPRMSICMPAHNRSVV